MTGKVEHAEAEAAASEELGQLTAGDTLEEEFKALEEAEVGDSLLAELMERVEAEETAQEESGVIDAELNRLKALMAGTPGPTIDVEVEEPVDSDSGDTVSMQAHVQLECSPEAVFPTLHAQGYNPFWLDSGEEVCLDGESNWAIGVQPSQIIRVEEGMETHSSVLRLFEMPYRTGKPSDKK